MTNRVNFYILQQAPEKARIDTACQIAEQVMHQGLTATIAVHDHSMQNWLDERLWTFKAESFIPHARLHQQAADVFVYIGLIEQISAARTHWLINLSLNKPQSPLAYQRIFEISRDEPAQITQARGLYKFYKSYGITPEHHKYNPERSTS